MFDAVRKKNMKELCANRGQVPDSWAECGLVCAERGRCDSVNTGLRHRAEGPGQLRQRFLISGRQGDGGGVATPTEGLVGRPGVGPQGRRGRRWG